MNTSQVGQFYARKVLNLFLDKVPSCTPSEKQAQIRVIQGALLQGKPLSVGFRMHRLADPHGILSSAYRFAVLVSS